MSGNLIEARKLIKHYDGFSLEGVSLTVSEGEVVGFIGQNGAGKSTTIKALLGLFPTDGGTSSVLGVPSDELSRASGAAVKEQVGVVFDAISLPEHLKVSDVGRIYERAYATWDARRFGRLAAEFGLDAKKTVKSLSRGMGMKLSLDPMARDEVLDLLRDFVAQPGHAVLMSSHITSDLERIADRIVCIDAGRIVFDLPKDVITDEMGVARCRVADLEKIADSGIIPDAELRYLRHDYGIDVLVPDRFAFAESFPEIPVDRMTIDDYMTLTLKGGVR